MADTAFIRLLDSNKETVLDSVAVEYEDSFCLENFGDLAMAFYNHDDNKGKKGFIIARVQTWDHKQPGKAFYSYYHAFHLNKILFQTQVYLGKKVFCLLNSIKLIHRLHVLNPLTNTDIIGNVQYFLVLKKEESPQSIIAQAEQKIIATNLDDTDSSNAIVAASPTSPVSPFAGLKIGSVMKSAITVQKSKGPSPLKIDTSTKKSGSAATTKQMTSATVREVERGASQLWTLSMPAVAVEEDENSFGPAVDAPKPKSLYSRVIVRPHSRSQKQDNRMITEEIQMPFTPLTAPPCPIPDPMEESIQAHATSALTPYLPYDADVTLDSNMKRRHTAVNITTKRTNKPISIKAPQSKVIVSPGLVTRFAIQVPEDELKSIVGSKYSRRRNLSYANAVATAGTKASVKEWLEMVKLEKQQDINHTQDNDVVKAFGTPSPPKAVSSPVKSSANRNFSRVPMITIMEQEELLVPEHQSATANVKEIVWDAILFATDTDFLESSKIRLRFKENAIVPEDAMLFKMKAYTGEEPAEVEVSLDDELVVLDCCYTSEAQINDPSLVIRAFHRFKRYIFVAILLLGIFFFIYFTLNGQHGTSPTGRGS